jgi:hypothetical protein
MGSHTQLEGCSCLLWVLEGSMQLAPLTTDFVRQNCLFFFSGLHVQTGSW